MQRKFNLLVALLGLSLSSFANQTISPKEAAKHVGEKVSICGKVTGGKAPGSNSSKSTILQLVDQSNGSTINVVIRLDDRKNFSYKPEEYLYAKQVCITGTIVENNGRTELIVNRPGEIRINDEGSSDIRPMDFDGMNRFFDED